MNVKLSITPQTTLADAKEISVDAAGAVVETKSVFTEKLIAVLETLGIKTAGEFWSAMAKQETAQPTLDALQTAGSNELAADASRAFRRVNHAIGKQMSPSNVQRQ